LKGRIVGSLFSGCGDTALCGTLVMLGITRYALNGVLGVDYYLYDNGDDCLLFFPNGKMSDILRSEGKPKSGTFTSGYQKRAMELGFVIKFEGDPVARFEDCVFCRHKYFELGDGKYGATREHHRENLNSLVDYNSRDLVTMMNVFRDKCVAQIICFGANQTIFDKHMYRYNVVNSTIQWVLGYLRDFEQGMNDPADDDRWAKFWKVALGDLNRSRARRIRRKFNKFRMNYGRQDWYRSIFRRATPYQRRQFSKYIDNRREMHRNDTAIEWLKSHRGEYPCYILDQHTDLDNDYTFASLPPKDVTFELHTTNTKGYFWSDVDMQDVGAVLDTTAAMFSGDRDTMEKAVQKIMK